MEQIRKSKWMYLAFVAPAFIIFIGLFVIPTIQTFSNSFYYWDGGVTRNFAGLDNFISLFSDKTLLTTFRNASYWIFSAVFMILPLSFIFALIIQSKVKGYKVFRTLFYMPCIISEMAIAIIWTFMLNTDSGMVNTLLRSFGLGSLIKGWLYDPKIAIFTCIFVNIWAYAGSNLLIYLGEMKSIPEEIYEAAEIDGAVGIKKVTAITIPLVWGTIKVTVFLTICASIQQFGLVYGLTGGGPGNATETFGTYMYKLGYRDQFFGYSSAVALCILIGSYIIVGLSNRLMKREDVEN